MEPPIRLFNRNFVLLWQGQIVSNLGNQVFLIAMIFWIKDMTGSASLIGLLLLLSGIPAVLLGPIGGTIADRHSRRMIILASDLLGGIAVLSLAAFVFLAPEATSITIIWLFVVAIVISATNPFFEPAIAASIPDLVPREKVAGANSLSQLGLEMAMLIGQAVGGVAYRLLGAPILFLVNGLSYLFSAISEAFITIPQEIPEQKGDWKDRLDEFKADLLKGLRYIWDIVGLRKLILLTTFVNFFSVPILLLLPFYIEDVLNLTTDWYGFLLAAYSVGTLVGYTIVGLINLRGKLRGWFMVASMFLEATSYIAIVVMGNPVIALFFAVTAGAASGFLIVNVTTILQLTTPAQMRGRVFGLVGTIAASVTPLASGLAGVVADAVDQNIPLIYLVCGVILLFLAVIMALSGDIREFLSIEATEVDTTDMESSGQPVPTNTP